MKRYLLISFSIHTAILAWLVITNLKWHHHSPYYLPNKIDTYLGKLNFHQSPSSPPKTLSQLTTKNNKVKIQAKTAKFNTSDTTKITRNSPQNPASRTATNPHPSSPLTLLLHGLIQTHIQYPAVFSPAFNHRTVILSFILFHDGHITDIKILQSSGIVLLDNAVLEGIASLPKITAAQKLLSKPEVFRIPVEFR